MAAYVASDFSIEWRWKEEVVYWEGDRGFLFDAGWGVDPPVLVVPSPEIWPEVVPEWMRDRRTLIVQRLTDHSGHVVEEDVHGHYFLVDPGTRVMTAGTRGT